MTNQHVLVALFAMVALAYSDARSGRAWLEVAAADAAARRRRREKAGLISVTDLTARMRERG